MISEEKSTIASGLYLDFYEGDILVSELNLVEGGPIVVSQNDNMFICIDEIMVEMDSISSLNLYYSNRANTVISLYKSIGRLIWWLGIICFAIIIVYSIFKSKRKVIG